MREKIYSNHANLTKSVEPDDETFYLLSRMNHANLSSVNSAIMVSIFSKNDFVNSRSNSVRDRNDKLKLHNQNLDESKENRYSISDSESEAVSRDLTTDLLLKVT